MTRDEAKTGFESLTNREKQVLRYAALGYSKPEVSQLMGLRVSTLRTHLERVTGKLGIAHQPGKRHSIEYTASALKHGLITIQEILTYAHG